MQPHSPLIHDNVRLGRETSVDPFCILGYPPKGHAQGELALTIGDGCTIRSHTVIYAGTTIGHRTQTGHHVLIRNATTIGDDCSIGSGSVVEFEVRIGDRVRLHSNVFVPERTILENDCWVGPNAVFTNARYPRSPHAKDQLQGVIVRERAKIGANVTLLPGVTVGADALVGAGAVVVGDVPAGAVVVGNPARTISSIRDLPYE